GIFPLIFNHGAPREIVTGFPYPSTAPYPQFLNIPYPTTGTANSAVRIGVVNAGGGDTKWMDVPGDPRDNYLARMEWAGNDKDLVVEQLNRKQNENNVFLTNTNSGEAHSIFQDKDDAWVDCMLALDWIRNGEQLLWLSERDGWRHAYAIPRD